MKNISRWLICITLAVAMVVTLGLAACEPTTVKATFEGGGVAALRATRPTTFPKR